MQALFGILVAGGVQGFGLVWETNSGFLRIQRLRLDSGYTRLRPSTEFMLNFTCFYLKASSDCEVGSRPRIVRSVLVLAIPNEHALFAFGKRTLLPGLVSGSLLFGVCVA